MPRIKWTIKIAGILASVAVVCVVYFRSAGSYVRVIQQVEFREPSGGVLTGFFDGLPKDPRYDLKSIKANAAAVAQTACGSVRPSLWSRILGKLVPIAVAHAQGDCTPTQCSTTVGYSAGGPVSCGGGTCGTSSTSTVVSNPGSPDGWQITSQGCTGNTCNCNQATCAPTAPCTSNADCGGRICSNGVCVPCTGPGQCGDGNVCNGGSCQSNPCAPGIQECVDQACTQTNYACQDSCCALSCSGSSCQFGGSCITGTCIDQCCVTGGSGGGGGECSEEGCSCSNNSDCDSDFCDDGTCQNLDPIVIDIGGRGYELTNAPNGVRFDFFGAGKLTQMAWTATAWDGGFLALDRNGNGKIDNGVELFGNITPQPKPCPAAGCNGFLALAVFDQPANGGNSDA